MVANGSWRAADHGAFTTWTWSAGKPMASYLATMATIGQFDLPPPRTVGISFWDAIDPDLSAAADAADRHRSSRSRQQADSAYKRLTRTIAVPAGGAQLSLLGQPRHRA